MSRGDVLHSSAQNPGHCSPVKSPPVTAESSHGYEATVRLLKIGSPHFMSYSDVAARFSTLLQCRRQVRLTGRSIEALCSQPFRFLLSVHASVRLLHRIVNTVL